jgi:hypothetical protein
MAGGGGANAKLLLQHRTKMAPDFELIFSELVSAGWEAHKARISHGGEAMGALGRGNITPLHPSPSTPIRQPPPLHQGTRLARPAVQRRNEGTITTIQL